MIIAVDFDGTIVENAYPDIGKPIPDAIKWLKRWQELGAKLVLWTARNDGRPDHGDVLTQALEFCKSHGIEFYGVNTISDSDSTTSPIVDAYVCPLAKNPRLGGKVYAVDWEVTGPEVESILLRGHIGA